jgi:glycosyltransferase involved in cell wall biosynthesis
VKDKLRILYVIDTLEVGGAESVCLDIFYNITIYDVCPDLLVIQGKNKTEYNLIKSRNIFYLNRKSKSSFGAYLKLTFLLRKYKIIHCHLNHTFRYVKCTQFLFYPFLFKQKIVLHDHGFGQMRNIKDVFLSKLFIPHFYITVTPEKSNWGQINYGLDIGKSAVLTNLLPRLGSENNLSITNKNQLKDLVIVGNVKYVKNHKFAALVAKELNRSLDIIGKLQDIECSEEVLKVSEGKVTFLTDIGDVSLVLPIYKMGLFTSFNESGPIVLLEYLASGLPFVSHNVGSIGKILEQYFPEMFLKNLVVEEWCGRISELNNSYQLDMDKVNFVFDNHFNREIYFKKLVDIYKKL